MSYILETYEKVTNNQLFDEISRFINQQERDRQISIEVPLNLTSLKSQDGELVHLLLARDHDSSILAVAVIVDMMRDSQYEVGFCVGESDLVGAFLNDILTTLRTKEGSITFVVDQRADMEIECLKWVGAEYQFSEAQLTVEKKLEESIGTISLIPYVPQSHQAFLEILMSAFQDQNDQANATIQLSLRDPERTLYGIYSQEQLVGVMNLIRSEVAMITAFAIHPEHQGKGYGKRALKKAIILLQKEGYERVSIDVEVTNEHALNLYKSVGFEILSIYDFYEY